LRPAKIALHICETHQLDSGFFVCAIGPFGLSGSRDFGFMLYKAMTVTLSGKPELSIVFELRISKKWQKPIEQSSFNAEHGRTDGKLLPVAVVAEH
jgi:hypothetical protein